MENRNYDPEIEDLRRDIEQLEIEKTNKEIRFRRVIIEQCESKSVRELLALRDKTTK